MRRRPGGGACAWAALETTRIPPCWLPILLDWRKQEKTDCTLFIPNMFRLSALAESPTRRLKVIHTKALRLGFERVLRALSLSTIFRLTAGCFRSLSPPPQSLAAPVCSWPGCSLAPSTRVSWPGCSCCWTRHSSSSQATGIFASRSVQDPRLSVDLRSRPTVQR